MPITLGNQRVEGAPLRGAHRLKLPPFGVDAEIVEALERTQDAVMGARQFHRQDDFQQQLMTARLHRVEERLNLRLLLEAMVDGVVGMVSHQALDDMLQWPRDQLGADRASAIEFQGIRTGELHRSADPPAPSRCSIERVLPVEIIAQQADAAVDTERALGLGDGIDEKTLQLGQTFLGREDVLRQLEELIAMSESEGEHL